MPTTLSALLFCGHLIAAPFIPSSDDQILEQLPIISNSVRSDLGVLRQRLSSNPEQIDTAITLAQNYIAIGKAEADPRYYGYAQGVLQSWWNETDPPSAILLLRATILQNRHEFENALRDLDTLLQRNPQTIDARLAQAVILIVQARYDEAKQSCLKLIEFKDALPAMTCLGHVGSLTGKASESFALLSDGLNNAIAASEDQRLWSLTVLAEMAVRMGKPEDAQRYFSDALKIRQNDVYLLTAYADFLLDQKRPSEVVALLSEKTRIDALLLRFALAKQQLGSKDLPSLIDTLKARFAASLLRGQSLHQGDEARLMLFLFNLPKEALTLAKANWQAQREPRDARILLEAALAAQQPEAAQPVIDLMNSSGMEDNTLKPLAASVQALKGTSKNYPIMLRQAQHERISN
ncbi:MAG: hypothetical protein HOP23_04180 [Methylococcaceae bacterium]|nr:hypothetical protein [Methylococcaceae bacterium]